MSKHFAMRDLLMRRSRSKTQFAQLSSSYICKKHKVGTGGKCPSEHGLSSYMQRLITSVQNVPAFLYGLLFVLCSHSVILIVTDMFLVSFSCFKYGIYKITFERNIMARSQCMITEPVAVLADFLCWPQPSGGSKFPLLTLARAHLHQGLGERNYLGVSSEF